MPKAGCFASRPGRLLCWSSSAKTKFGPTCFGTSSIHPLATVYVLLVVLKPFLKVGRCFFAWRKRWNSPTHFAKKCLAKWVKFPQHILEEASVLFFPSAWWGRFLESGGVFCVGEMGGMFWGEKNPHKSNSFFYFLILLVEMGVSCGFIFDGSFKFKINFQTWTRTELHRKRWISWVHTRNQQLESGWEMHCPVIRLARWRRTFCDL